MTTLTYCKALPSISDYTSLGCSRFESFLFSYATVFRKAKIETIRQLQSVNNFDKSAWNSQLQSSFGINKRHANGVIASAKGAINSAIECRKNHISQLKGKVNSAADWISKAEKKLKDARKFYRKANWPSSKTGCRLPLACSLFRGRTNWQNLRFKIHHKKRYVEHLKRKIESLEKASIHVSVPHDDVFVVGSKDESFGNQVCQWNGDTVQFRVPKCLEDKFGQVVTTYLGEFDRRLNRLPSDGAKTWHFYRKKEKWVAAVQFTPSPVESVSRHSDYGCIGIDINPSSVGWVYVDAQGNLQAHGQVPLQQGLSQGKQQAQIVDACLQLVALAETFACPIIHEQLDFSAKKESFREKGRKYARMLSGWAYSEFFKQLGAISANRGVYIFDVNSAYTSLIGMVKYARMYGLSSDTAAALAIARRGMRLSENLPSSITAFLDVKSGKHVWSLWNQLNKKIQASTIKRRHDFYSVSNWEDVVKSSG